MPATVGPPVSAVAPSRGELRQSLPSTLVEALDKIGCQIEIELLDPLLCSASVEELAKAFEMAFPRFRDYYISTVLITWGFFRENGDRFSTLTIRSFQESERLIRDRGPRWIGREASLNALSGLATMIRVAKAAKKFSGEESTFNVLHLERWASSAVAYAMAFSSVLAAFTALENGRTTSHRLENVASLAGWSKNYAAQAYHFTKSLGFLSPSIPGTLPSVDADEDDVLAEAGLDSYADALAQDDQP
jgi:hypothetical protein